MVTKDFPVARRKSHPHNLRGDRLTRGRPPSRALEYTGAITKDRGLVQRCLRGPESVCDLTIYVKGRYVAHVRIKCVRRLRGTVREIERERAQEVAVLRFIVSSREISREIWLCSPRYAWRFFRDLDEGIVEIGRDGAPLLMTSPGN